MTWNSGLKFDLLYQHEFLSESWWLANLPGLSTHLELYDGNATNLDDLFSGILLRFRGLRNLTFVMDRSRRDLKRLQKYLTSIISDSIHVETC